MRTEATQTIADERKKIDEARTANALELQDLEAKILKARKDLEEAQRKAQSGGK
jgi:prefoldin subunit 5